MNHYIELFEKEEFEHIAITCDMWSDMMTARGFLGITGHFLENNSLRSKILAVKEVGERHTASNLAQNLEDVLCGQYKIDKSKIVCIVTDNGPNIVSAVNLFLDRKFHLSCFAHTLNLVAESLLNNEEIVTITMKVREIIKFFKNSVIKSNLLRKAQSDGGVSQPLKVILDVKTRWNSLYYMLERFICLVRFIQNIILEDRNAPPFLSGIEIDNIKKFIEILKPLEYATKVLSGDKYATLGQVIPIVHSIKAQLNATRSNGEVFIENAKKIVLEEINRRFAQMEENSLVAISCILDPRFKAIHFVDPLASSKAITHIKREIKHLEEQRSSESSEGETQQQSENPKFDFWSYHKSLAHSRKSTRRDVERRDELSVYLANPVSPLNTDPIILWDEMKSVFPSLYILALKYVIIPATSVPAERLFSKAGTTLNQTRNRLTGKRVEKLLFLSDCSPEEWGIA